MGNGAGLELNLYEMAALPAAPSLTETPTVAFLGGATKGEAHKAIRVQTELEAISAFGFPLTTDSGLQALLAYLKDGGSAIYVRCGKPASEANGLRTANRDIPGQEITTPGVRADGDIEATDDAPPEDGDLITISDGTNSKSFEFDDNDTITGDYGVRIESTLAGSLQNLAATINASVVNLDATYDDVPAKDTIWLYNTVAVGATGNVTITSTPAGAGGITGWTLTGMLNGVNQVLGATTAAITLEAASPGTWGNTTKAVFSATTVPSGTGVDMTIYAPVVPGETAGEVEKYLNLSLDSTDARYITDVLANGVIGEVNASDYVRATVLSTAYSITTGATEYTLGDAGGQVGANGITAMTYVHIVGTISGQTATGLKTLQDGDKVKLDAICVPGWTHKDVLTELTTLCEGRGDCEGYQDLPFGISEDKAIEWTNGDVPAGVPNSPTAAINSRFIAVCGWWQKIYDPYNKVDIYVPPVAYMAQRLAHTWSILKGPYWAFGGQSRGILTGVDVAEYSPPSMGNVRGDLDEAKINYFVDVMDLGIVLMSDITTQRLASPLNRLHSQHLLLFLVKQLGEITDRIIMDPNDPISWARFQSQANRILAKAVTARGLDLGECICNENTNPEEGRGQGVMRGKLLLVFTDIIYKVVLDFTATSSGVTVTL